jgi:hypothetical protein
MVADQRGEEVPTVMTDTPNQPDGSRWKPVLFVVGIIVAIPAGIILAGTVLL